MVGVVSVGCYVAFGIRDTGQQIARMSQGNVSSAVTDAHEMILVVFESQRLSKAVRNFGQFAVGMG